MMTRFITIVLFLMISAYSVAAQEDTIEVSNMATTHSYYAYSILIGTEICRYFQ